MNGRGDADGAQGKTDELSDEDPQVAQLGSCAKLYLALEDCLGEPTSERSPRSLVFFCSLPDVFIPVGENERDWRACQKHVHKLQECIASAKKEEERRQKP